MSSDPYQEKLSKAYDEYAEAIYRHCFFRGFPKERAEELVQDTFLKTWDYLRQGNSIENLRAFLYRVVNNLMVDEFRKKKEQSLDQMMEKGWNVDSGDDPEDGLEQRFLIKEVLSVMDGLPEKERELLVMRYVDGLELKEIAEVLQISANNTSVRLNRAMKVLKDRLNNKEQ